MKRFLLNAPPGPGGMIRLYEADYHYLVRVRRLENGSLFDALLPCGKETRVKVLSTGDNILIGECLDLPERTPAENGHSPFGAPLPPIALFQGLPKGAKMDLIVRQAAEGGLSLVVPFESEYSAVRSGGDFGGKPQRWERIVREARQQSGSFIETKVTPPRGFDAMLAFWESLKKEYARPAGIVLHQEPLEKGSFHGYLGNSPDFAALAVGPEGGFSPREISLLTAAGWKPALMGGTVLRTETAALYGAAAIRILLLESETWTPRQKESCS